MRKEEAKNLRRTFLFSLLTLLFLLGIVFWGIPLLAKVAVFFSEVKSSNIPIEQSDVLPPSPPKINSLPEATNNNSISLSGFAEPGSTVEIFLNQSSFKKVVSAGDGTFVVDNLTLTEDQNEIYATAQDSSGNKSQPSPKMMISFDKIPPELVINEPQDQAHFAGEKQKKARVSGKTEPQATLTINDHLEVLDKDGNFSFAYSLSDGENILKFVATDKAENQTNKEIKVNFTP